MTDCELVEEVVDPFCSFEADWTQEFNDKMGEPDGTSFTVSMWIKILGEYMQPSVNGMTNAAWGEFPCSIRMLSQVGAPPSNPQTQLPSVFNRQRSRSTGGADRVRVGRRLLPRRCCSTLQSTASRCNLSSTLQA